MSEDQTPEAEQAPVAPDAEAAPVIEAPVEPVVAPVAEPDAAEATDDADVPVTEPATPEPAASVDAPEAEAPTEPDAETDDLAEAIAEASDRVESEDGEQPAAGQPDSDEQAAPAQFVMPEYDATASTVSWWPFIIYDLVWLAFAGYMVWRFEQLPAGTALFDAELYPVMVLVGIVLTIAGPLLILTAWIASFRKPGASKGHLFVSALIKGAVAMAIGVTLWWGAILVLDQLRLGALI